jgi:phosphoglycolate phosphatase-like HAD superfamily hydrolase
VAIDFVTKRHGHARARYAHLDVAVRALFFDFDGVLWDSEVAALQSWQETFAEQGQRMAFDVFATTLGTLEGEDPIDELERLVRWPIDREEIAAPSLGSEDGAGPTAAPTTRRARLHRGSP